MTTLPEQGVMLRIFIGENDRCPETGRPLYEAIVLKARELGLAGATAYRGLLGFGKNSRIHAARVLVLSSDLPIVVEIVDSEEKAQTLLPWLDGNIREGLVTIENIRVIHYRGEGKRKG